MIIKDKLGIKKNRIGHRDLEIGDGKAEQILWRGGGGAVGERKRETERERDR